MGIDDAKKNQSPNHLRSFESNLCKSWKLSLEVTGKHGDKVYGF
jgi:hypothetical protein